MPYPEYCFGRIMSGLKHRLTYLCRLMGQKKLIRFAGIKNISKCVAISRRHGWQLE